MFLDVDMRTNDQTNIHMGQPTPGVGEGGGLEGEWFSSHNPLATNK